MLSYRFVSASVVPLLLATITHATIDYSKFTHFNHVVNNGPSIATGATNREVAVFYVRNLIELGERVGNSSREDIAKDLAEVVNSTLSLIQRIEKNELDMQTGIYQIGYLYSGHYYYMVQSSVSAQALMTPLQQRGANLWTQLSAADAETLSQMVPTYLAAIGFLPDLQIQTKAKLESTFDRMLTMTPADPDSCCFGPLMRMITHIMGDILDEYTAATIKHQNDAVEKITKLLGL